MSYDYYLFKKPALCPRWIGRVRALIGSSGSIGSDIEVKEQLSKLFPHLIWKEQKLQIKLPGPPRKDSVLFGAPSPEFQIDAAPDGTVTSFVMKRAEPKEIRLVEKTMGLVAMDMQRDGFLSIIFTSA